MVMAAVILAVYFIVYGTERHAMTLHLELAPLISLGAGIGILVFPRLLNYIVAGYLIALGVLGLLGRGL